MKNEYEDLRTGIEERYRDLNDLWGKVEEHFKRFLIPCSVVHEYQMGRGVAWGKSKGAWRLCHGVRSSSDEKWNFTPISDSGVEIRQSCISYIQPLRQLMIEKAKEIIPRLDESIHALAVVLDSLRGEIEE